MEHASNFPLGGLRGLSFWPKNGVHPKLHPFHPIFLEIIFFKTTLVFLFLEKMYSKIIYVEKINFS
jgi:hypothetical protein